MDLLERFSGSLLGLAVGDALGMPWEFRSRGSFPRVTGMATGGVHHAKLGEWTDDTSMAFCLAESLIRHGGWNPGDAADRFRQWYRAGYWSCREDCFDIGNTTACAILKFEKSGDPFAGSDDPNFAGNGSIMRLAPIALFFHRSAHLLEVAEESSRLTHGAETCLHACRLLAHLIAGALVGYDKVELLSPSYMTKAAPEGGFCDEIAAIAQGAFHDASVEEIESTGYVVHTLEAALWCWARTDTFSDATLLAVNLGDDTDTTAAVVGQLVGAYVGLGGIPDPWHEALVYRKRLIRTTEQLYEAMG